MQARDAVQEGSSKYRHSILIISFMERADWFEKCRVEAEQGNAEQQYALGMYYEHGYGVDEDLDEALVGIVWLPNRAMLRHRTNLDYVMKRAGACLCVLKRQSVGIVWLLSREMQMGSFT